MAAPRPFEEDCHNDPVIAYFYCYTKVDNYMQKRRLFISCRFLSDSRHKILGLGMVDDDGVGALLRLQVKLLGKAHAYVLLGFEQAEDLRLVFQIRAGRVAEGVTLAAIFLVKQIRDTRGVFACDAEQLARLFVD